MLRLVNSISPLETNVANSEPIFKLEPTIGKNNHDFITSYDFTQKY